MKQAILTKASEPDLAKCDLALVSVHYVMKDVINGKKMTSQDLEVEITIPAANVVKRRELPATSLRSKTSR